MFQQSQTARDAAGYAKPSGGGSSSAAPPPGLRSNNSRRNKRVSPVTRGLRQRHASDEEETPSKNKKQHTKKNNKYALEDAAAADAASSDAAVDSTATTTASVGNDAGPKRLYVLIHGLGGTCDDLLCLERNLLERGGEDVLVLRPACNNSLGSFDGVPAGGTRVAEEIRAVVASHPSLTHLTLVGNSLGGIYARYAAALLYEEEESKVEGVVTSVDASSATVGTGTMAGLIPDTYLTTASPHLGVGPFGYLSLFPRGFRNAVGRRLGDSCAQLMLLDGDSSSITHSSVRAAAVHVGATGGEQGGGGGRSGGRRGGACEEEEEVNKDKEDIGKGGGRGGGGGAKGEGKEYCSSSSSKRRVPLLVTMADPSGGYIIKKGDDDSSGGGAPPPRVVHHHPPFMRALGSFRRRCTYANAINDFLVPYESSALDPDAPAVLRATKLERQEKLLNRTGDGDGDGGSGTRKRGWAGARAGVEKEEEEGATAAATARAAGKSSKSGRQRKLFSPRRILDVLSTLGLSRPRSGEDTLLDAGAGAGRSSRGAPRIADVRNHPGCFSRSGTVEERDGDELMWQRVMASGLKTLSWTHVDVEFPGILPLAHNKICALSRTPLLRWMFKEGEVVVAHQAEYLLDWREQQDEKKEEVVVGGEPHRGRRREVIPASHHIEN